MAKPRTGTAAIDSTGQNETTKKIDGTSEEYRQPISEILDRLAKAQPQIAKYDERLAQAIADLVKQSADPGRLNQQAFQHEVAYAFQDFERRARTVPLTPEARTEVIRLAGSAPGLENERMLTLMRSTASVEDRGIVRDIRRAGTEIGQQADQNGPAVVSRIEVLENRVRLAQRPPEAAPLAPNQKPREQASPSSDARDGQEPDTDPANRAPNTRVHAVGPTEARQTPPVIQGFIKPGPFDSIVSLLRGSAQGQTPWDPAPTPFAERLRSFQGAQRARQDEGALHDAERSARAALNALEGFRNGEGATVMNRISAAARSNPEGFAGVLAEMRPGGRFSDLRQQFNNAMADEKGFASAYDGAASALAQYGAKRPGIEQIIARRADAINLTAKFQQLDAEIGEAASSTPSRRDGKAMLDDIARQTAEMIARAIEAIRSLFGQSSPRAVSEPSAGPSPG